MTTLALPDEHPLFANPHIRQIQTQHLAPAQPSQQHRLDHGAITIRSQHRQEGVASQGFSTRGRVRGVRKTGTERPRPPPRRVAIPPGTGFTSTPASPRNLKYSNNPEIDARRRLIVRADSPASPSSNRTTPRPRRGALCCFKNVSTSRVLTSAGSLGTTVKKTFKSYETANNVFGRVLAATNSR
jgi:hypothetical protein